MDPAIGTRLKTFRKRWKIKMRQVEAATGISVQNLYKWEKGIKPSDFDQYTRLNRYMTETEKKLEKGLPLDGKDSSPTLYHASYNLTCKDVTIPNIHDIVHFSDESMRPHYRPGCRLCLVKVADFKKLVWGNVYYLVDLNGAGVLRRVYPTEEPDKINLVSYDRQEYPDITRDYKELNSAYEIAAILLK